jgi:hypothetical protein
MGVDDFEDFRQAGLQLTGGQQRLTDFQERRQLVDFSSVKIRPFRRLNNGRRHLCFRFPIAFKSSNSSSTACGCIARRAREYTSELGDSNGPDGARDEDDSKLSAAIDIFVHSAHSSCHHH